MTRGMREVAFEGIVAGVSEGVGEDVVDDKEARRKFVGKALRSVVQTRDRYVDALAFARHN
jgi:hypothetical protein